jgi:hypothetical protein
LEVLFTNIFEQLGASALTLAALSLLVGLAIGLVLGRRRGKCLRPIQCAHAGATAEELEKRTAAELIEGSPALFLDTLNNTAFKSSLLASAITERPARVRLLGRSQMVPLSATAFVILTGNGLTVSKDLARRFVAVDFDPRTENAARGSQKKLH